MEDYYFITCLANTFKENYQRNSRYMHSFTLLPGGVLKPRHLCRPKYF